MTITEIIDDIIRVEGSTYTNDPADPGGPTKYGITLKALRRWRGIRAMHSTKTIAEDVRALTRAEAALIYNKHYVLDPGFERLPWEVRAPVVDAGVHFGPQAATRQLQQAIDVTADGILGPVTLGVVHETDTYQALLIGLATVRLDAYARQIHRSVTLHDRKLRALIEDATDLTELRLAVGSIGSIGRVTKIRFIRGWLARAVSFLE